VLIFYKEKNNTDSLICQLDDKMIDNYSARMDGGCLKHSF